MNRARSGPHERSPFWGEDRSRYHFAAKYVSGRLVVDLSERSTHAPIYPDAGATEVVALVSKDREHQPPVRENLAVVMCDHKRIPLPRQSCDVACCLGILQHGGQVPGRAHELRRILRPGGVAVLSIPNALHVPWSKNRRLWTGYGETPERLHSSLADYFGKVEVVGQRVHPRYSVVPFWGSRDRVRRLSRSRYHAATWMVRHRLPFPIKDGLERLLHNRAFYPSEFDYQFDEANIDETHHLVAVCHT